MRIILKSQTSLFFLLLILAGCKSLSLDDFREEGEGVTRSLIQTLQTIHNREELLAASERIEYLFDRLVSVMIEAAALYDSLPDSEKAEVIRSSYDLSDPLRIELNRLYRLEGGRTLIEKYQDRPLQRLDAFEKQRIKKKSSRKEFIHRNFNYN
jgi:hypothetical protein